MELEFLAHNTHLDSPERFEQTDPHLRRMLAQQHVFHSPIIEALPANIPDIYNLGGGRQVGKSTLLKQWMLHLLRAGIAPSAIAFLSCELIFDEKSLYRMVTDQLSEMPDEHLRYLILDEITYVKHWDKAIKYLADMGAFERVVVVISGSDLVMMQEARKRFPGRRGQADTVDFHYYPLSFRQCFKLKQGISEDIDDSAYLSGNKLALLFDEFSQYLIHGGFLTAINEYAATSSISARTLATYSDWIRGDVIKNGKKEHYLKEILGAILKHYSSQISWRHLIKALSIDHTQTAIDYISLLESMDAVFVQSALIEDKLVGAPKKDRKFMFRDPFIFHAVRAWLTPTRHPYEEQIIKCLENKKIFSSLVETTVVTHFARRYPTYYVKADGEVGIAYVNQNKFWPIEIKWTNQLRPGELKQIMKYKNGSIWSKSYTESKIGDIPVLPLPWALFSSDIETP